MGYVPLFDHLTTGSLHGKWPDIGLWPIVLSLANRHGEIDVTPEYIAACCGLPTSDVISCMERFCAPDSYSRTKEYEGRKLALIDPERPWGWVVLNHSTYRERARLLAKRQTETESGADAARKRASRAAAKSPPESAAVRRSPPESGGFRLSDSDSDTDTDVRGSAPTERCPAERDPGPVERVFEHWKLVHRHPRASLDTKRRKLIRERLKDYSEADLCLAITGYGNSPHHMGQNDRGTKYDDLGLFLRDASHVDAGLRFANHPPLAKLSKLTRQNIANTEGWMPPEMRRATN